MDVTEKAYLKSLIPEGLPKGADILQQGIEIGKQVVAGKSRYQEERGYASDVDFRQEMKEKGKMVWGIIMGLASVDEQIEGMKYLYDFSQRTGAEIDTYFIIANMLTGLPPELRAKAPKGTSFIFEKPEDWQRMAQVVPVSIDFGDFHLGAPYALETTIQAIENGSSYTGVFSQLHWDLPGYHNDIELVSNNLKTLGILATKWDEKFVAGTYYDDGLPGYFLDYASYLGYALFERYIIRDLCGARYAGSYGQMMNSPVHKVAFTMACCQLLGEEDQPGVDYVYSNAIDHWDHDIEANYGVSLPEYLMLIAANQKYHLGIRIQLIPTTEKIAVPTPEAIANMVAAARRLEEKADQWVEMMDFRNCEKMRDILIEKGTQFFHNLLDGLTEAGLDIEDPMEMLMVIRKIDAIKVEKLFHPSVRENPDGQFTPYIPTSMGQQCLEEKDQIVSLLESKGYANKLAGKRVVLVSADSHYYGAFVVDEVLSALGAEVINGGVDFDPVDVLDLADEEKPDLICISVHNGQALDYSKQLLELCESHGKSWPIYMGGKLNGILPGQPRPQDVSGYINEMGIFACNSLEETVEKMLNTR